MSTLTEDGVSKVKEIACDKLLEQRVEMKMRSKTLANSMNRLHLAMPTLRDNKDRPPCIPNSVIQSRMVKMNEDEDNNIHSEKQKKERKERKEMEFTTHPVGEEELPENFDPTYFGPDFKDNYLLNNEEWKHDIIPEIFNGMNVADYIDPEIMERLQQLEKEEEDRLLQNGPDMLDDDDFDEMTEEEKSMYSKVMEKKSLIIQDHRLTKSTHRNNIVPRKIEEKEVKEFESHLNDLGLDATKAIKRARSRSSSRSGRSLSVDRSKRQKIEGGKSKSKSKERSLSKSPAPGSGFKNIKQKIQAESIVKKLQKKNNRKARRGEADRTILNEKPKHLFSGKRGVGKTQRR